MPGIGGSVGFGILKSAQVVGEEWNAENPTGRISVGFGHGFRQDWAPIEDGI